MSQIASPSKPSHTKLIIIIVATTIAGVLLVGWLVYRFINNPVDNNQGQSAIDVAQSIDTYPTSYIAAQLPQYPVVKITSLSKKTDKVENGISLILYSNDKAADVAKFYDEKLKALGWAPKDSSVTFSDAPFSQEYTKDNQRFEFLVNSTSGQEFISVITITWETKK